MDNTFIKTDGGRSKYFKGQDAGDCGARALALAAGIDYKLAYQKLAEQNFKSKGIRTARGGISKKDFEIVIREFGFTWQSAPKFEGRKARFYDLPTDRPVIASMAKHLVAVIDGVVHDQWDCREKMVYGYWVQQATLTSK